MTDTTELGTALALPTEQSLVAMFAKPDRIEDMIARIEAEVKSEAPDVTTAKGRKAIASLAYKVAQSKTALDAAGKGLNDEARKKIEAVDAERRKIRERLDALKAEVRKPLDEWEDAEEKRVEDIKARLARLRDAEPDDDTSASIATLIRHIEATPIDDSWQEFVTQAAPIKDNRLADLRVRLEAAQKREAEAEELARLRAEAEARAEADRQREAAEQAEAQRVAAERAEAERQAQYEREKQEAAQRAAEEAEAKAKEAAAQAEREYAEREAQYQRQLDEAKAREEAAAQAERDRIAEEQRRADEARAKREADQRHRDSIASDIADALRSMSGKATPEAIAAALIDGKIPHCKVSM